MMIMTANTKSSEFREQNAVEKVFNRAMGFFAGLGFAPGYMYLLQVRGRKSGKVYATPVNLMEVAGKKILVAPRGRTQWVCNAEAAGEITLKRGSALRKFRLKAIPDGDKPEFLKLYLDRYASMVQKFFPVKAGSDVEAFREIAANYPVFELQEA
jgi:deazaflavin-dependent oxidoreductase (nitroreductase family)